MFVGLRDLRHAWGRFVLMGSVIALVAVLTVLLTGLSTGLVNSGNSGLRAMPLTDLAFQPKTNSTFSQSTLDAATIRSLGRQPDIRAEPLGLAFFNARDAAGKSLSIALVGIEPRGFMAMGLAGGSELGRSRLAGRRAPDRCRRPDHRAGSRVVTARDVTASTMTDRGGLRLDQVCLRYADGDGEVVDTLDDVSLGDGRLGPAGALAEQ